VSPPPSPAQLLTHGLRLLAAGVSVIPVETEGERAKRPHYQALVGTGHCERKYSQRARREVNVPRWESFQHERATPDELEAWIMQFHCRGLAMVTGELSGMVAIDFDDQGLSLLDALGWTPHQLTPSGGGHVFVKHPGWRVRTAKASGMRNPAMALPEGVDVRGDGGYVLIAPTVISKGAYVRTQQRKFLPREAIPETVTHRGVTCRFRAALTLDQDPAEHQQPVLDVPVRLPARLGANLGGQVREEDLASDYGASLSAIMQRALDIGCTRGRNEGGFFLACQLRDNGYSPQQALDYYDTYASCLPDTDTKGRSAPYTPDEYAASVQSAFRRRRRGGWKPSHA